MSGTAVIVAAVVGFVLLVSLQALREWPDVGIGFGDDGGGSAAVSDNQAVASPGAPGAPATGHPAAQGGPSVAAGVAARAPQSTAAVPARHRRPTNAAHGRADAVKRTGHVAASTPTAVAPTRQPGSTADVPSTPPAEAVGADGGQTTTTSEGAGGEIPIDRVGDKQSNGVGSNPEVRDILGMDGDGQSESGDGLPVEPPEGEDGDHSLPVTPPSEVDESFPNLPIGNFGGHGKPSSDQFEFPPGLVP
ncbi:MAG TPA: hypothetical protein VGF04_11205 [Solirubrobacterales bacterium]|jgi:hypothetical protein